MPKGSPELTEKRKNEILDACRKIYGAQGFYGVTVKGISAQVSLTRPAIYNYFETKEEILLGLLVREYADWCGELERVVALAGGLSREELSAEMAHTLEEREILLRILNMNLFEIELNSRVERLAEFKGQFLRAVNAMSEILRAYRKGAEESECEEFCQTFSAFLLGCYPFTVHTEKQIEAMRLANVKMREPGIYEMVYRCVYRLL